MEKSDSTVTKDLSVHLRQQDPIDPGSLILIILKKWTLCFISSWHVFKILFDSHLVVINFVPISDCLWVWPVNLIWMHALQEHNSIPVMKSSMGINSKLILVEKDHLGGWTPITLIIFFNSIHFKVCYSWVQTIF